MLGFIHSGSPFGTEWLGSDRSLATTHAIGVSMRHEYSLNRRCYPVSKGFAGYAIGRYCEDAYDGDGKVKTCIGNPWYLCTLAHAEFYYRLIPHFASQSINVNSVNELFYMDLARFFNVTGVDGKPLKAGQSYPAGSKGHLDLLDAFRARGDAFVAVVKDNARWNGGLWEQFDRNNGRELGAPDLT